MSESTNPPQAGSTPSEADADSSGESAAPAEPTVGGIGDEQLPEDLQPTEDNPLAQPLDPDAEDTKSPEELGMDETQQDPEDQAQGGADDGAEDDTEGTDGSEGTHADDSGGTDS